MSYGVFDVLCYLLGKGTNFHRTLITLTLFSYRNFAVFLLFLAYDKHIRYALELVFANFLADFFVAVIDDGADVGLVELVDNAASVVIEFLGDGQHYHLVGREPQGQMSGSVLKQYGHEAFERPEGCAVDHHGTMLEVVGAGVLEAEALGQVVVYLYCSELPTATYGVFDHEVEFGAVECGFAEFLACLEAFFFAGFDDGGFGQVPIFIAADVFFFVFGVAQRDLCLVVVEVECLEDIEDDIHHFEELVFDLLGGAEDVCIVLRKSAYAGQSMEFARLLVAVYGAEFGDTQGQFAIAAREGAEDFAVVGAVHGLE